MPKVLNLSRANRMAPSALSSMKRVALIATLLLAIFNGVTALGQTPVGWNGTWAGGWDRGVGVQLVFAGDQLVAFNWRGDYKDVRRASAGKGTKRFAWENGEATLTRATDDSAELVLREQGQPELSIVLKRE